MDQRYLPPLRKAQNPVPASIFLPLIFKASLFIRQQGYSVLVFWKIILRVHGDRLEALAMMKPANLNGCGS